MQLDLPTYLKIWCHIWMLSEPISNFVFIILSGNFLTERTILSWLMASRLSCETQSFVTLTFSIITLAKWAFQMTTNGPFHCLQREFWSFFFYSIHFSRPKLNVSCKKGFVQNWVWSWSTKLGRMFFLENFNAKDMGALNISGSLNNATFGFGKKSCWVNSFNTTQGVMRVSRWLKVT